ncbi:MAG: hypothetical protein IH956_01765 [Chloroflexi bacterium]|nr:hypothetical protein [Chloroflexota bacterium]
MDEARSQSLKPKISSVVFLLILGFFLLPWLSISCGSIKVSYDGTEIIFGKRGVNQQTTEVGPGEELSAENVAEVESEVGSAIYALAALVLAAIGVITFFIKDGRVGAGVRGAIGALGIASLVTLKFKTESQLTSSLTDSPELAELGIEASDLAIFLQIDWGIGYWLAFLGFGVVVALQYVPVERILSPWKT